MERRPSGWYSGERTAGCRARTWDLSVALSNSMVAALQSVIPVSSKMKWASEECSNRTRKRSAVRTSLLGTGPHRRNRSAAEPHQTQDRDQYEESQSDYLCHHERRFRLRRREGFERGDLLEALHDQHYFVEIYRDH